MVHLIRNRLTNPSSASCESLEGTVTETTVKGPEPDDLDPDECGSDVDIDEEDMETFDKGDGVFWAKTTHRYVAKYKRETLRFPVGKKLKGPSRTEWKQQQRTRALNFARNGTILPLEKLESETAEGGG